MTAEELDVYERNFFPEKDKSLDIRLRRHKDGGSPDVNILLLSLSRHPRILGATARWILPAACPQTAPALRIITVTYTQS